MQITMDQPGTRVNDVIRNIIFRQIFLSDVARRIDQITRILGNLPSNNGWHGSIHDSLQQGVSCYLQWAR
jgi:hypothetical protein